MNHSLLVGILLDRQDVAPINLVYVSPSRQKTASEYLLPERERLLAPITEIRDSSAVASANVWISPDFQNKGGKIYEYYKLTSENPEVKH